MNERPEGQDVPQGAFPAPDPSRPHAPYTFRFDHRPVASGYSLARNAFNAL